MGTKESYQEKVEAQLAKWRAKFRESRARTEVINAEVRNKNENQLTRYRKRRRKWNNNSKDQGQQAKTATEISSRSWKGHRRVERGDS